MSELKFTIKIAAQLSEAKAVEKTLLAQIAAAKAAKQPTEALASALAKVQQQIRRVSG